MRKITNTNRNIDVPPYMRGGWNPALRSLFPMTDGRIWFAADSGKSHQNTAIAYYQLDLGEWKQRGSCFLDCGITQNLATISDGRKLYSYGCGRGRLWETWFDCEDPAFNYRHSNTFGPAVNEAASNYSGAMMFGGRRMYWWTTVGVDGSGGTWAYMHTRGTPNGWNAAVPTSLHKFASLGYVIGRAHGEEFFGLGQLHRGIYPGGSRSLAGVRIKKLGQPAVIATPAADSQRSTSPVPMDLLITGSRVHVLAYDGGFIQYLTGQTGLWPSSLNLESVIDGKQARFLRWKDGITLLVASEAGITSTFAPEEDFDKPIRWSMLESKLERYPVEIRGGIASAIWGFDGVPVAPMYAICGPYPEQDNLVFSSP